MHDLPEIGHATERAGSSSLGLVVLRLLALAGLLVSGYLLFVSVGQQRLPVGCGAGSGCASVLASRWSSVLGLPVGAVAVAGYVAVLIATFGIGPSPRLSTRVAAWSVLIAAAVAIVSAAGWFVGLQLFVIQAICPWCMADHAIGLLVTMTVGYLLWNEQKAALLSRSGVVRPSMPLVLPALAGLASVILLAGTQILLESPAGRTIRLPPGQNADSGPGTNRRIAVIDGKIQLSPHEQPIVGSADSPKLLIVLFDYCCPHCRATHGYLLNALPTFDGQLSVLFMPMPMDQKCNKSVDHTEPRFEHACELARLALAVWRAKPAEFARFDHWLFEPEEPRDPVAARRKAVELVGESALQTALGDPWIDQQIGANVQAYVDSGADRIPIIMSPGFSSIVGRPESEEELLKTLRDELNLPGKTPQQPTN